MGGTSLRYPLPTPSSPDPHPPEVAMADDKALHETLDLLSQVVASISDRLDRQSETLDRLAAAQAAASPDRVAGATALAVREALGPHLLKIVSVMEDLGGGKALLRERLRAMDREEARQGRWRTHPAALVVGIPLALILLLALAVPRAVAQTSVTCRATGGTWYEASERYPAACLFSRRAQGG